MRLNTIILSLVGIAAAQNSSAPSACDKYTTALLKVNNATNQYTLLTLVVNTALIGNYTQPNVGISVNGILKPGTYNGTAINLLPYFDGSLNSTDRGGTGGVSVNFLDDGGAAPLLKNLPSNGNQTSNQYKLITHLYEFFGVLLGCSMVGQNGFPAYGGSTSMYTTHKFMDLNAAELGYFITQVGTAAASFGVTSDDVNAVGMALNNAFGYKCSPPAAIPPSAPAALQAICIASDCPTAPMATCAAYGNAIAPAYTNGTVFNAPGATSGTASGSAQASGSASATASKSGSSPGISRSDGLIGSTFVALLVGAAALGFAVLL